MALVSGDLAIAAVAPVVNWLLLPPPNAEAAKNTWRYYDMPLQGAAAAIAVLTFWSVWHMERHPVDVRKDSTAIRYAM